MDQNSPQDFPRVLVYQFAVLFLRFFKKKVFSSLLERHLLFLIFSGKVFRVGEVLPNKFLESHIGSVS